jgi:hypothetical protein
MPRLKMPGETYSRPRVERRRTEDEDDDPLCAGNVIEKTTVVADCGVTGAAVLRVGGATL